MAHQYSNDYASGGYASQGYNDRSRSPYDAYDPPAHPPPSNAASSTYLGSMPPAYTSSPSSTTASTANVNAYHSDPERAQTQGQYGNSYGQYNGAPGQYGAGSSSSAHNVPGGPSPFDTVFDDHMYPATAKPGAVADTSYYGAGGHPHGTNSPSNDSVFAADGIPLQNRNKPYGSDSPDHMQNMPDHVYDVPQGAPGAPGVAGTAAANGGNSKVRFGELGMLGANNRKRIPWVVYMFTIIQVAVFIGEIVKNGLVTGSPIMIKPSFNVMIGPSTYVLINMGSRFVPCMHNVKGIQSSTVAINWPCPNTTTNDADSASNMCTLSELCGFNGVPNPNYDGNADQSPEPNQWFRFITPMFLHSGVIHIGFNMLLQMTLGRDMERSIGPIRFFIVYVSSGIFGFVMGGNYAATGISSTGASGALFGIIALTLLDLLYSWRDRRHPKKDLLFIMLDVVISFVLGLLPGLDNFSHIGGFIMGLALGISVLHSPNALRRRIGEDPTYASVSDNRGGYSLESLKSSSFIQSPVGFFKGRKPLWWGWWLLRAGAIVLVIVAFILLLNNFYYYHNTCSWCKYLSCLPINNWCEIGNLQLTNSSTKRDLFTSAAPRLVQLL